MNIKGWRKKTNKLSEEDIKDFYDDFLSTFRIGIEIEGESPSFTDYKFIAEELNCDIGKGRFRRNKDFLYCYNDGSVNTELVTGAIPLKKLRKVLKIGLDVLQEYDVKMSPEVGAGGHQNICSSQLLPNIIGRNVLQITRQYLPALCKIGCVLGTHHRNINYRTYPECGLNNYIDNVKYSAVHLKKRGGRNGLTGGLYEFRYPDSTINLNQIMLSAIINSALVLKAINISRYGVLSLDYIEIMKSKDCYSEIIELNSTNHSFVNRMVESLLEFLDEELKSIYRFPIIEKAIDEIIERKILFNGEDLQTMIW